MQFQSLQYTKLGQGARILLAFHGAGQNGVSCYQPFADTMGHYYTIYAFDLYYHGADKTPMSYDYDDVLSKERWVYEIQHFLNNNLITRFDIAGFSLGGRFALATLEKFSHQIDRAILMAPDGVTEHPIYTLATRFKPVRKTFAWFMQNPNYLIRISSTLNSLKIIHNSLYHFVTQILNTPQKRLQIYSAWIGFRDLYFNIPQLYSLIEQHQVELFVFVGKYDKLLPQKAVYPIEKLLPKNRFIVVPCGHTQIVERVSAYNFIKNQTNN